MINNLNSEKNLDLKLSIYHIILIFISSFLIGFIFLSNLSKTMPKDNLPVGVDVYPLWSGTQAFLNGESPYTKSVQLESQQFIYGREANIGEDPFPYYYPIYTSVILVPITLFDADQAAILWPSLMLAIYTTIFIVISFSFPKQLPPLLWGAFILSIFLFRPGTLTILNGQYGIFIIACWIMSWVLYQNKSDYLSGLCFALSLLKPSLSIIPVGIVLLWSLTKNRRQIVYGFLSAFLVISALSFIGNGWWVPDFLDQIGKFTNKTTSWDIQNILSIPGFLWLLSSLFLISIGIKENKLKKEFPHLIFLGGIFVNLIITPHTAEYDLIILLIPIIYIAKFLIRRQSGYIFLIAILWFPWISWISFRLANLSYESWQRSIWMSYPLIISVSLIFYYYKNNNNKVFRPTPQLVNK